MELGFGFITCQRYPGDPRTDADLYREALELTELAEALGYDAAWTSEHHFADDAYLPSLLPVSAAMAARTSRIAIGTGLVLAPIYPPLRLAEDAATVDLISGGRLILGLGLGWLDWEFEALGVLLRERVGRTVETIEICRQAWGPGRVEHAGRHYRVENLTVTPKPARPGGPPIWLGATAEPAVRRAARIADGWMASAPTLEQFREQVGWFLDELAKAGRHREEVVISTYQPTFAWDEGDAWAKVRPFAHYLEWKYEDADAYRGRLGPLPLPPALTVETEAALRAFHVVGTPDEVAAGMGAYAAIAGEPFHFVARCYFPGLPLAEQRETMRLVARAAGRV